MSSEEPKLPTLKLKFKVGSAPEGQKDKKSKKQKKEKRKKESEKEEASSSISKRRKKRHHEKEKEEQVTIGDDAVQPTRSKKKEKKSKKEKKQKKPKKEEEPEIQLDEEDEEVDIDSPPPDIVDDDEIDVGEDEYVDIEEDDDSEGAEFSGLMNRGLTKRQKAMVRRAEGDEGEEEAELVALPMKRGTKQLTEEQQLLKTETARRRKKQQERQLEIEKTAVVDKLLHRQAKKVDKKKEDQKEKVLEEIQAAKLPKGPTITYTNNSRGTFVTFPPEVPIPDILSQAPRDYPAQRPTCETLGCTNQRRYSDAKTGKSLCSLNCYKSLQGTAS